MQIIVIRHARTEFNKKELINGTFDEPLSEEGLQQIDDIIRSLSSYTFTDIYASTLKRSIQTAAPIAKARNIPLQKDPRITEVDLGSFTGKGWDSTIPYFGLNSSGLLSTCEYDFTPFGGESSGQTNARVQSFINDLRKNPSATPLIVTHGGILRWFHYLCTGEKAGRIPNSSIHTFTI
jgi:broad specificity phosphatase PhoE